MLDTSDLAWAMDVATSLCRRSDGGQVTLDSGTAVGFSSMAAVSLCVLRSRSRRRTERTGIGLEVGGELWRRER